MTLEGRVLMILQNEDATSEDIASKLDVDKEIVEAVLERLKDEGFLVEVK